MTDPLNRDDIIELLDKLGGDDDAEVLAAARQAHAQIAEAGMTWDDLLVSERSEDDTPDDEPEDDEYLDSEDEDEGEDEDEDEDEEAPAGNDAESSKLIKKMLARKGISADLREELNGYKADIAEGEFTQADHRYLAALNARLSKKS